MEPTWKHVMSFEQINSFGVCDTHPVEDSLAGYCPFSTSGGERWRLQQRSHLVWVAHGHGHLVVLTRLWLWRSLLVWITVKTKKGRAHCLILHLQVWLADTVSLRFIVIISHSSPFLSASSFCRSTFKTAPGGGDTSVFSVVFSFSPSPLKRHTASVVRPILFKFSCVMTRQSENTERQTEMGEECWIAAGCVCDISLACKS